MTPEIGMVLELAGKNNRGRQRIQTYGSQWKIEKLSQTVQFDSRIGAWALLKSIEKDGVCWMHLNSDINLTIVAVL